MAKKFIPPSDAEVEFTPPEDAVVDEQPLKKKVSTEMGTSMSSDSKPLIFKDVEPYSGDQKSTFEQFASEAPSTESKSEEIPTVSAASDFKTLETEKALPEAERKLKEREYSDSALEGFINAIERGKQQGEIADIINSGQQLTPDQINRIAELKRKESQLPASKAYQDFSNAKTVGEMASVLAKDPVEVLSQLTSESMSALLRHGYNRVLVGAAEGGAAGSVIPGVGTMVGVGAGTLAGMTMADFNLEYSNSILQSLQEAGVNVTDEKSLSEAFGNKDTMDKAKDYALKRGVPIALFDLVSGGLGGKILGTGAKTIGKKVLKGAAEVGVQTGLAAGGEAAAQYLSEGKLTPTEIFAEAIGEIGGGAPDIVVGRIINKKKVDENIDTDLASLNVPKETFDDMVDVSVGTGEISNQQASEVKQRYSQMESAKEAIPDEYKNEVDVIKAVAEKHRLQEQLNEVNKRMSGIDDAFLGEYQSEISSIQNKIDEVNNIIKSKVNEEKSKIVDTEVATESTSTPEIDNAIINEVKNVEPVNTQENAIQEPSAEGVFPRQQGEITETGGEREGMGQGIEGIETPEAGQEKVVPIAEMSDDEYVNRFVNSGMFNSLRDVYSERVDFSDMSKDEIERGIKHIREGKDSVAANKLKENIIKTKATGYIPIIQGTGGQSIKGNREINIFEEDIGAAPVSLNENELESANNIPDNLQKIITEEGITKDNIDNIIKELGGFPYDENDLQTIKEYLNAEPESQTAIASETEASAPRSEGVEEKSTEETKRQYAEYESYFASKVKPEQGKRKQSKVQRKEFIKSKDPRAQYIMENMDSMLQQLVNKGIITTNCL